ncbi:actinia tenebrosa protease inhibitors [Zeugodacus cucurbitae]|nr:actinia tenebrosa protease inhibitors [Zeugodacus cucurbitae]
MAVHFQRCLRVLLLIVAISVVSSAPQQKQTKAQKQAAVSGLAGGGGGAQARVQDPKCLQPKEPGPCRMNLERYYYNSQTNTCEKFKFGGCRGNDNKFGFLKTCEDACLQPKTATNNAPAGNAKVPAVVPAAAPAAVPAAVPTAVPKNPKPAAITTNTNTKAKKTPTAAYLLYPQTTTNSYRMKFALTLCFAACFIASLQAAAVDPTTTQLPANDEDATTTVAAEVANDFYSECYQPREVGRCFGLFRRYAYNADSRRCEEFVYGGCGGNRNNFESKEACESTCLRGNDDERSTTAKAAANDEAAPVIPAEEVATAA